MGPRIKIDSNLNRFLEHQYLGHDLRCDTMLLNITKDKTEGMRWQGQWDKRKWIAMEL